MTSSDVRTRNTPPAYYSQAPQQNLSRQPGGPKPSPRPTSFPPVTPHRIASRNMTPELATRILDNVTQAMTDMSQVIVDRDNVPRRDREVFNRHARRVLDRFHTAMADFHANPRVDLNQHLVQQLAALGSANLRLSGHAAVLSAQLGNSCKYDDPRVSERLSHKLYTTTSVNGMIRGFESALIGGKAAATLPQLAAFVNNVVKTAGDVLNILYEELMRI